MEIVGSTTNYISKIGTASKKTYCKTNKVYPQGKNTIEKSETTDALTYYKNLCSKYPNISFRLTDYVNGTNASGYNLGYNNSMNQVGENFGAMGQCSIEIDISVVEKMMKDTKYAEHANGWIQAFEQNYSGHAVDVASSGYSNFCFTLHDFGNGIETGRTDSHNAFSTEAEVKKMWANDEYKNKATKYTEQKKAALTDAYLKMLEESRLKQILVSKSRYYTSINQEKNHFASNDHTLYSF